MPFHLECADLPDVFAFDDRALDLRSDEVLRSKDDGFRTLIRCADCGQHWQIDSDEREGVRLAIRIHHPEFWGSHDDRPLRMSYLVVSHGGLSDTPCTMPDCQAMSVLGLELCPYHASKEWN